MPNPNPSQIAVLLEGRTQVLSLRIYGQSMRMLAHADAGPVGPGWVSMPLPPEFPSQASGGTYYYRVSSLGGGGGLAGRLFILK